MTKVTPSCDVRHSHYVPPRFGPVWIPRILRCT